MTVSLSRASFGAELRATILLALPLIGGQLASGGLVVVDALLAGHLGASVLAAVGIGTGFYSIAFMSALGVNGAVAPSVAQLDGAGRRRDVGPLFRQAMLVACGLGVILSLLLFFLLPILARQFGFAPRLEADIVVFLRAASPAGFAISVFACCRGLSEGLSLTRPTLAFTLLGLITLAPLGYVLMYGAFGMPGMGVLGSGLALAVTCAVQALGYALWIRFAPMYDGLGWEHASFRPDPAAIAALLRIGVPMAVALLLETTLFGVAGFAIGRFGDVAASGHQIALSVASFAFMVPLGISIAMTVRVGNAVGRNDADAVRRAGMAGGLLVMAVQTVSAITFLAVPHGIASLYTGVPEVVEGAAVLLGYAAIFQLSDGLQVAGIGGLRGLKDTRMPMFITAFAYWIVGMPTGLSLAFWAGWKAEGMWTGMIVGLTVAAALLCARFFVLSRRFSLALARVA